MISPYLADAGRLGSLGCCEYYTPDIKVGGFGMLGDSVGVRGNKGWVTKREVLMAVSLDENLALGMSAIMIWAADTETRQANPTLGPSPGCERCLPRAGSPDGPGTGSPRSLRRTGWWAYSHVVNSPVPGNSTCH